VRTSSPTPAASGASLGFNRQRSPARRVRLGKSGEVSNLGISPPRRRLHAIHHINNLDELNDIWHECEALQNQIDELHKIVLAREK
jgi:hypothetical protein